jgi:uncharacterized protein involved in outer membrane biogenesis
MSYSTGNLTRRIAGYLRRHRARLGVLVLVIALYAALGFLLAPWLLQKNAIEGVRETLDSELSVKHIAINPFALSLRIDGLVLKDPVGAPLVSADQIYVNFQLSSIFRWALTFDEIRLDAPNLYLDRDEAGDLNIAYLFEKSPDAPVEPEQEAEPSAPPRLLVFNFAVNNSVLHWADRQPAVPVMTHFGPVNIDIKDLNTLPKRSGQQSVVITTESSGTLSWSGNLQLNPLYSAGTAKMVGSHFPVPSAYLRQSTGFDIVNGLSDVSLDYTIQVDPNGVFRATVDGLDIAFRDVLVRKQDPSTTGSSAPADREVLSIPGFELAGGSLRWPERSVSVESLTIDDTVLSFYRNQAGQLNWLPPEKDAPEGGSASAPAVDDEAPSEPWDISLGRLEINRLAIGLVDDSVQPQADIGLASVDLAISGISNAPGARFPAQSTMQTRSGGIITLQGEIGVLPEPDVAFDIKGENLLLAVLHPYIQPLADVNLDSGALNFTASLKSNTDNPVALAGNFEIVDFLITETDEGTRLGSWDKLEISKLDLSLAEEKLEISEIRFAKPYADIFIAADSSVNLGRIQKGKQSSGEDPAVDQGAPAEETATENEHGMAVTIGRVVIADGAANFADFSLPLPFDAKIAALNGSVSTITTESAEPSVVALEGKVDEYGFVSISGSVTPLQPALNTDLKVAFQNVEMPKFSAYTVPFAGRAIASGKLDLSLGYKVKDNELAGENTIVLRDFELGDKVDHPGAMSLPLGLAVALLKDPSGKIDIDLPVRGNVNDPEFGYGRVILNALSNLILKIVASPFALLGNLIGVEASQLEQINFMAGRSDLTPPEIERVVKIVEALALRPELVLQISGAVDREVDRQALKAAHLDQEIDARIAAKTGDSEKSMYVQQRRSVIEALYVERLAGDDPKSELAKIRQQFTALVPVRGSDKPSEQFDELAYVSFINQELSDAETIPDQELETLAADRASNVRAAALSLDETLHNRIRIGGEQAASAEEDQVVPMKITLSTGD